MSMSEAELISMRDDLLQQLDELRAALEPIARISWLGDSSTVQLKIGYTSEPHGDFTAADLERVRRAWQRIRRP